MKKNIGMVLHGDVSKDLRVLNEIKFLTSAGYTVTVLTPGRGAREQRADPPCTVEKAGISGRISDLLFGLSNTADFFGPIWRRQISAFVKRNRIDLIHAHDLFMGGPAAKAARECGIPMVNDLHENFPAAVMSYAWVHKFPQRLFARPEVWETKEKSILTSADGLVVLSDHYRDSLSEKYPELQNIPTAIYPNVPDVEAMTAFEKKPVEFKKSAFCMLYFGAIGQRRGLHTAAEALEILNADEKRCELLVIGHVHKNERDYFDKIAARDGVTHIPWIPVSMLRSYMEECDICISPILKNDQHESGIANKVYQYMLYEKPLLVSDCIPQQALVESAQCGLAHRSEDSRDFAEKAAWMMTHPEALRKMAENGKKAVLEKYNLETQGKALTGLYGEVFDRQKD